VENLETGGAFGTRLARSVTTKRQTEVIVLFGGKGVGKSTFLRRLLFFRPPHILTKHAVCSIVDLLETPSIKDSIHASIWDKIAQDLDKDGVLLADRTRLLELFSDKFEQAKRQSLFGLSESSDLYQTELNKLVASWLQDKKYCAKKLAATWLRKHRGVIVVIDNTDQFPPELQDFCFTIAHEVSRELGALVVISMREERFYSSTIRGTLDAYHNYGFHIASPDPTDVFLRRLRYVISFLAKKQNRIRVWGHEPSGATPQRIVRLLRIFEKEFNSSSSHLAEFLTACAHGDIRYVLSIFRDLVLSRYTNVTEMTSAVDLWTILVHQVLKPLMIPYRFFYSEQESAIPNVFQIRSAKRGSHFTALRILQSLATGDPTQPPFVPVPRIAADFTQVFNMQEEFQLNLDALLRAKMVEADNRMEAYSPDLDSIRITPYGRYMLKELSGYFTYLDLVAVDCGVFSEGLANNLVVLSNQEYELYSAGLDDRGRRVKRVEKRLDKAGAFVKYLVQEEEREIAFYDLQDRPRIALPIAERFAQESANVLRSAKKQKSQRVQFE
jgi:RNAse (barnase) inhibitor barstar